MWAKGCDLGMGSDILSSVKKDRILIVEDDALNIVALSLILGEKYNLNICKDGLEAVEVARSQMPDLILLDVVMPGIDGFEVIARLKDLQETCNIPVIFITGLSNSVSEVRGLSLGAADYINKPLTPAIVELRVKNQMTIIRQMRKIQKLSTTDTLTNIANRRHFNVWLEQEWKRGAREQEPISLIMLDADKFKDYNDTYGHMQGDVALATLARIFKEHARRAMDLVARWGGEEFAVLLPSTCHSGAKAVAERIRRDVEEAVIMNSEGKPTRITVSIGVNTVLPQAGQSFESFISETDLALYKAKQTGRNKVSSAEGLE